MALILSVCLPVETVATLRDSSQLEGVLTLLADSTGPFGTVHDVMRAVIAGIKGLPVDIVMKVEDDSITSIDPPDTPVTTAPDEAGSDEDPLTWGIEVTVRSSMKDHVMLFDDPATFADIADCYVMRLWNEDVRHIPSDFIFTVPGFDEPIDVNHDAYHKLVRSVGVMNNAIIFVAENPVISVTFRDAMMLEQHMTTRKDVSALELFLTYCEQTNKLMDYFTFSLESERHGEELGDNPNLNLNQRLYKFGIRNGTVITVKPKVVKDMQVIFRDTMNIEESIVAKATMTIDSLISIYIDRTGRDLNSLRFTYDGMDIPVTAGGSLQKLGVTDGAVINVTPKPVPGPYLFDKVGTLSREDSLTNSVAGMSIASKFPDYAGYDGW